MRIVQRYGRTRRRTLDEAVEAAHEMTEEARPVSTVDEEVEEDAPFAAPLELIDETVADEDLRFDWFILKVQVNREDSIKDALLRRVKMNGLDITAVASASQFIRRNLPGRGGQNASCAGVKQKDESAYPDPDMGVSCPEP